MKKRVLFVASLFLATATFAQDGLTSKKGEAYLPEAGDWSIGIDANPIINYAGNLFNGNTFNSAGAGATWFAPNMAIYGKMFKDETTAYRGMLRIGFGSTTTTNIFDTSSTVTPVELTDEMKTSYNNIVLGGGIEKRRGNTRIQGVYGAMIMIGFGGSSTTYDYGHGFSDDVVATWTDNFTAGTTTTSNGPRTTEMKNGSTFMLGLQGFIGVEWFFAPKVSLGAEYTWGLAMNSTGEGEQTTEQWTLASPSATANSLVTRTTKTGKTSSFGLDTGISGANISLNFHF
ncbi:MAG: hypothetical protein VR77_01960 [Flavobacteriales bacterium BRH_c54]|jgi:hypothetical protein|nr:MAG: hypothetical protein VR77_01960 [Flavobacteriales bacterium BRH_c54]